jgi:hypothetical protein
VSEATVVIEERHLDTDERRREERTVPSPHDPTEERTRLVQLVAELHPEATHRSYADGAATFLAPHHLIVAYYEQRIAFAGPPRRAGRPDQDRLFD